MRFYTSLFGVFVLFAFIATFLLTPWPSPVISVAVGFFIGLAGRSGGQTASAFVAPLLGIVSGVALACALPVYLVSQFTWKTVLMLLVVSTVTYVIGHILGLRILRTRRVKQH